MRGNAYRFKPSGRRGHEQQGRRFAIVVQASRFEHLSTWTVIPTSTSAKPTIYRPPVVIPGEGESLALCEAVVSIDPAMRLGELLGSLTYTEMQDIDAGLRLLLDLDYV